MCRKRVAPSLTLRRCRWAVSDFPVSGASRGAGGGSGSSGPSLAVVTDTWQYAPVSELAEADPSLGHALVKRCAQSRCTRFTALALTLTDELLLGVVRMTQRTLAILRCALSLRLTPRVSNGLEHAHHAAFRVGQLATHRLVHYQRQVRRRARPQRPRQAKRLTARPGRSERHYGVLEGVAADGRPGSPGGGWRGVCDTPLLTMTVLCAMNLAGDRKSERSGGLCHGASAAPLVGAPLDATNVPHPRDPDCALRALAARCAIPQSARVCPPAPLPTLITRLIKTVRAGGNSQTPSWCNRLRWQAA